MVKLKPGALLQSADLHRSAGTAEVKQLLKGTMSLVRVTTGEPLAAVLARYRSDPRVAYAEPNYYRYLATAPGLQATPNDPFYADQWHYGSIGLPSAWNAVTGSALVVVAVIDSGILPHEDLAGVTVAGFDFFNNDSNPADPGCPAASDLSHGSHVAGTIAAATNNGRGVAGVNWGGAGRTRVMPLRIFGNIGGNCTTTSDRIVEAITYAADHSARVINMS
ncbi:MAG TPA: S8 family serine peptidase, partial [Gemmatimonadales bacterium]|nr:S8 family serine peptidase [Gemmatimonadales bacterium]